MGRKKIVSKNEEIPEVIEDSKKSIDSIFLARKSDTKSCLFSPRFYPAESEKILFLAKKYGIKPTRVISNIVSDFLKEIEVK